MEKRNPRVFHAGLGATINRIPHNTGTLMSWSAWVANSERTDQFGNRIHWEDEVDPESLLPRAAAALANRATDWAPVAAGAAGTALAYWRGHPISEEDLPTEQLVSPNKRGRQQTAFGEWTSEPRSFERWGAKFQRTGDRTSSTLNNLLNIGARPTPSRIWPPKITTIYNPQRTKPMAGFFTRRYRRPGMGLRLGYNRRFGAGKYRRGNRIPRGFVGRTAEEKKYFDLSLPINSAYGTAGNTMGFTNDQTGAGAVANIACLNSPIQGDDATMHDGRKIKTSPWICDSPSTQRQYNSCRRRAAIW